MQTFIPFVLIIGVALAAVYLGDEEVNGIPVEVREYWMRRAMQVQFDTQGTPCPRGPFGALIVDHTPLRDFPEDNPNGTLMCVSSGIVPTFTTLYHGEVTTILNCAQALQDRFGSPQGRNFSLWNRFTMYSTGEPCPMCAGVIHWQRLREIAFAVPIRILTRNGRPQIHVQTQFIHLHAEELSVDTNTGEVAYPIDVIKNVLMEELTPYFVWQFDADAPCPGGCERSNETLPGETFPRCVEV